MVFKPGREFLESKTLYPNDWWPKGSLFQDPLIDYGPRPVAEVSLLEEFWRNLI